MKVTITDIQVGDIITTMLYGFRVIAEVIGFDDTPQDQRQYKCSLICKEDGTTKWWLDFGQGTYAGPGFQFWCNYNNIVRAFEWACQADGHTSAVAKFEESCYA